MCDILANIDHKQHAPVCISNKSPPHPWSPGWRVWNIPVPLWINPNDFDASLSFGTPSPWGSHLRFPVKYLDEFGV